MNSSIELFLLTSCLATVFISIWIANLMVANSLARVISLRVATKFKLNYKQLDIICVDRKNKLFINSGILVLIVVGYFSYRDYGIFYTLMLPAISLFSIFISQQFVFADTFAKERIDELLEFLLSKESLYKNENNSQLANVQLLCNFIIDEYKYESSSNNTSTNISDFHVEGFEKAKHHISNIANDLSSGIKLLLIVIAIGLVSVGVRQLLREDNKNQNINPTKLLEEAQKIVNDKQKAKP